jgi:hypothetical protein
LSAARESGPFALRNEIRLSKKIRCEGETRRAERDLFLRYAVIFAETVRFRWPKRK